MPTIRIDLKGADDLIRKLEAIGSQADGAVDDAVEATALEVRDIARERSPHDTGTLRRSIVVREGMEGTKARDVFTNVIYAPRQNWGFVGTDSLGRTYNQPGSFFMSIAAARGGRLLVKNITEAVEELV